MTVSIVRGAGASQLLGLFSKALPYTSLFGRMWYFTLGLRSIMIFTIKTDIFNNDESSFKCSTKQFLCEAVCFNQFMPMNLSRFWTWQMVGLGLCAFFFIYLIEGPRKDIDLLTRLEQKDDPNSHETDKLEKLRKKYPDYQIPMVYRGRKEVMGHSRAKPIKFVHHILLLGIEVVFCYVYLLLLKHQYHHKTSWAELILTGKILQTPPSYVCEVNALHNQIGPLSARSPFFPFDKAQSVCRQADPVCTVGRFTEKTFYTRFMFAGNVAAVVTLVLEICRIFLKSSHRRFGQLRRSGLIGGRKIRPMDSPREIPNGRSSSPFAQLGLPLPKAATVPAHLNAT